jgi:hypothetical protein
MSCLLHGAVQTPVHPFEALHSLHTGNPLVVCATEKLGDKHYKSGRLAGGTSSKKGIGNSASALC